MFKLFKMANNKVILISFLISFVYGYQYCDDLAALSDFDFKQISGIWYGVEIVHHTKEEYKTENTDQCFRFNISEIYIEPISAPGFITPDIGNELQVRYFILEWHESDQQIDYKVVIHNSIKGLWTIDTFNPYAGKEEKAGVIQVLTIGNNYMVLNFCMSRPQSQLYSVVLARNENQLTHEDLTNIHNIFTEKNLPTSSLQRGCNSASILTATNIFLFIILLRFLP